MPTPRIVPVTVLAGILNLCFLLSNGLAANEQFDVASVKPNRSGLPTRVYASPGGRFVAVNASLRTLIQFAFAVKDSEILGGPNWLETEKYDIEARADTPKTLTEDEWRPLLQSLVHDRFGLKYHREMREGSVYSLILAGKTPKIAAHVGTSPPTAGTSYSQGIVTLNATAVDMTRLANVLGRQLGHTVEDHTGLPGEFDLKLEWTADPNANLSKPSLLIAIQEQLGLKLEVRKAPLEILVVDAAERASSN